jgi:hypothetical protein
MPEQVFCPAIGQCNLPLDVHQKDAVGRSFDHSTQALLLLLAQRLGLGLTGEIAEDHDHADHLASGRMRQRGIHVQQRAPAVARHRHDPLLVAHQQALLEHQVNRIGLQMTGGPPFPRKHFPVAAADGLGLGPAQHAGGFLVELRDARVAVRGEKPRLDAGQRQRQALLCLGEGECVQWVPGSWACGQAGGGARHEAKSIAGLARALSRRAAAATR